VAPTGNDANPGTTAKPFGTLERARDAVREMKKSGRSDLAATVWLSGGDYELAKTFELDAADSGTAQAPIVYRSVPGQQARLVGGRSIPSGAFKLVRNDDALRRPDPIARGKSSKRT
jgi:hypothetical protein